MTDDIRGLAAEEIESDSALRLLIARVCGHYVYSSPEAAEARRRLYDNINRFEMADDAERFVTERVRDSIEFYMEHFRLKGINGYI